MVTPYRCPSCRLSHFDEIAPRAYKCNWCNESFTEQDVIEDGGYHPFADESEYVEVEFIEPPNDLPNFADQVREQIVIALGFPIDFFKE